MTKDLKWFANQSGVEVFICGPGWGGRYGYRTADYPNCAVCGFRTKCDARKAWVTDTFGDMAAFALLELLSSPSTT